jgi:hypothetical protein
LAIIFVFFGISSWAQEARHELTVQGSGSFNKQTSDGGITNKPTNSGGVMAGYRFNLKSWLAVEADYDYFRNGQKLLGSSGTTFIPMNVHASTGTAIVRLPSFKVPTVKVLSPFVLAGGGAMFFDPRGESVLWRADSSRVCLWRWVDVPMLKAFPRAPTISGICV